MPAKGYAISGAVTAGLVVPCADRLATWFGGMFIAGTDGRILVIWWSEDET